MPETNETKTIDATPSEDISNLISSLKKADEEPLKADEEPLKEVTRKAGKKKGSKKRVQKAKKKKVVRKSPKRNNKRTSKGNKRFRFPLSLTNFVTLVVVLGIFVAAHISMKMHEEKAAPLTISTVSITPEEEVQGETEDVKLQAEGNYVEPQAEPQVEQQAEPQAEGEKAAEVTASPPEDAPKETVEKPVVRKKTKAMRKAPPRPAEEDPYTAGGSSDLDGPDARAKYLSGNVIKVPKQTEPTLAKKSLPDVTDTANEEPVLDEDQ